MKKFLPTLISLLTLGVLVGCGPKPEPSVSDDPTPSTEPTPDTEVPPIEEPVSPTWELTLAEPYTGDYWDEALNNDLEGEELRAHLKAFMDSKIHRITYNQCQAALDEMDRDPRNPKNIISLYDLNSIPKTERNIRFNREHTFPQSKLADGDDNLRAKPNTANISSDVANLFYCDANLNEGRSNYSYWGLGVKEKYYKYCLRNTYGTLTDSFVYQGKYSPTPKVRGEIARAQLYMVVMYPERCGINENFDIVTMLQWNLEHPATVERDLQRQAGLEKYQNLRNPFIDHPEIGCRIFGYLDPEGHACGK
ncbi:MAG: endonuclease [Bacilli bacterium]